jgi:hypothetical protein
MFFIQENILIRKWKELFRLLLKALDLDKDNWWFPLPHPSLTEMHDEKTSINLYILIQFHLFLHKNKNIKKKIKNKK